MIFNILICDDHNPAQQQANLQNISEMIWDKGKPVIDYIMNAWKNGEITTEFYWGSNQQNRAESFGEQIPFFKLPITMIPYTRLTLGYQKHEADILSFTNIYFNLIVGNDKFSSAIGNFGADYNIVYRNRQYSSFKSLMKLPSRRLKDAEQQEQYFYDEYPLKDKMWGDFIGKYIWKDSMWAGIYIFGIAITICNNKDFGASYAYITKNKHLLLEFGALGRIPSSIDIYDLFVVAQLWSSILIGANYDIHQHTNDLKKNLDNLDITISINPFGFIENLKYYNVLLSMITWIIMPTFTIKLNLNKKPIMQLDIVLISMIYVLIRYDFNAADDNKLALIFSVAIKYVKFRKEFNQKETKDLLDKWLPQNPTAGMQEPL